MNESPTAERPAPARIAVITVSFGSEAVLPAFLSSIPMSSEAADLETLVVDNRGDDDVKRLADSFGATYLRLEANRGYGGAINAGAAVISAETDWILIANPDLELLDGSIDRLLAVGSSDPSIGSIGPKVMTPTGEVYPSARALPSLRTGIGHALLANLWPSNPWSRSYLRDRVDIHQRDAGWLSGSCLLVRRSAFDRIGGFDEGYFMYFEDVDLGQRLGSAGYRNIYAPSAKVVHSGAHATEGDSVAMIAAHHASAKRYLVRKYRNPILAPLRLALMVGIEARRFIVSHRRHEVRTRH